MMKTVKIVYTGPYKDGVALEDGTICKPGVPVDVPEIIVRKSEHRVGLLSRPDFKEFKETISQPEPK